MKWIKANNRLPSILSSETIFRQASTKSVLSFNMAKDWVEDGAISDLQWLDESQSLPPSTAEGTELFTREQMEAGISAGLSVGYDHNFDISDRSKAVKMIFDSLNNKQQ